MSGSRSLDDLGPLVSDWPVETVSAGVTDARSTVGLAGNPDRVARIASVGKLLVGMAAMVALEEGAIALDEPAGPEASTVRHLLAHASELAGVLPEVGRFDPNPWGLTFEIRDDKRPHWTGARNSPETFGHFGGSGAFLWVDPVAGIGAAAIADREFGPWALDAWPPFSDAVLERSAVRRG